MVLKENILDVVGGPHVAAIATVNGKLSAVRFMVLNGFPDMTFVGGTRKSSKKVAQHKKESQRGDSDLVRQRVFRSLCRDPGQRGCSS
jgi:hypothetical protein